MQRYKKILLTIAMAASMLMPAATAHALVSGENGINKSSNDVCGSIGSGSLTPNAKDTCANVGAGSTTEVDARIKSVVKLLSAIVGIIAVVMIVIGGFRYITSGGASDKVTSAKNTILYAIVGLIIIAMANIIVSFVIGQATQTGNS